VILQVGETFDGVQLQEFLQVFWNRNRVHRIPEEGMRVEGDGNGTGAKASNHEGNGIVLILVLPRSLILWIAKGLWSMAEGKMTMGSGSLPRLWRQVAASNNGSSMMEAK
jgi:hypothetical protein